jgi:hypothetical protein
MIAGRGRDANCLAPPPTDPYGRSLACTALPSDVGGKLPAAHRPTPGIRLLPLCVGAVLDRAMFSLGHSLPSTTSAEGFPSLFSSFIRTLAWSDSSATCMWAVCLSPSPTGLLVPFPTGVTEVSRLSCTNLPGVSGVQDYAGLTGDSRSCLRSCCLPLNPQRRRPDCVSSKLDTQPSCTSVYASPDTSRHVTQNSKPSGSLPLSRKTLAFSASCRFIPAHGLPFCPSG